MAANWNLMNSPQQAGDWVTSLPTFPLVRPSFSYLFPIVNLVYITTFNGKTLTRCLCLCLHLCLHLCTSLPCLPKKSLPLLLSRGAEASGNYPSSSYWDLLSHTAAGLLWAGLHTWTCKFFVCLLTDCLPNACERQERGACFDFS